MTKPFTPRHAIRWITSDGYTEISIGKLHRWNREEARHDRQWNKRRMSKRTKRLNP